MPQHTLEESTPAQLPISDEIAKTLSHLGRQLASKKTYWGEEEPPPDRTVIRCRPVETGAWEVAVVDCIGLIAAGDHRIEVRPKIPLTHLIFLLAEAKQLPRPDDTPIDAMAAESLWHLLALWYVSAGEALLRRDLTRDYAKQEDELAIVRGRVALLPTTRGYYRGRLRVHCEFEEFTTDTALNRVIKGAASAVFASDQLPLNLRRRARGILSRMDEVGPLRAGDLRARLERRTQYYADALVLARHILTGVHRTVALGDARSWSFLIPTPLLVEEGLRRLLQRRLAGRWRVEAGGRRLLGSSMTLNPDLVFGNDLAVADVKYKIATGEWQRPDLYQIVTFAEGYGTSSGAVLGFRRRHGAALGPIQIGRKRLRYLSWAADDRLAPEIAADRVVADVQGWLIAEEQS